jgi:hypothetical protein
LVVGFTTTCAISDYHHWSCEFEPHSLQGVLDTTFVIKFVSDLRQVSGFLRSDLEMFVLVSQIILMDLSFRFRFMVFNTTFNNISVILWWSSH